MNLQWHDLVGNLGVAALIVTYLLLQLDRINPRGLAYSALNAAGAGLILISLAFDFNLSAAIIEGFWLLISLYGIVASQRRRRLIQTDGVRLAGPHQ